MKRVSKNLTKAITLSVLLMLPYGMAWAETHTDVISGANDNYSSDIKTYDDKKDAYVYDFSKKDVISINDKYDYRGSNNYVIKADGENIIINNKVDLYIEPKNYETNNDRVISGAILIDSSKDTAFLDRRYGGNIVVKNGFDGVEITGSNGGTAYLGNGHINLSYKGEHYTDNSILSIDQGTINEVGNLLVYGQGTLTGDGKGTGGDSARNDLSGVSIEYNCNGGNNIILGYKGNYSDVDVNEYFNVDKLSEQAKKLGEISIDVTSINTKNYVDSTTNYARGITLTKVSEWNKDTSDKAANNIIIGGTVNIKAIADSYGNGSIVSGAVGIENQADGVYANLKNISNFITLNKAEIEIKAKNENTNGIAQSFGIYSNSTDGKSVVTLNEKSSINATAEAAGYLIGYGIYSVKDGGKSSIVNTGAMDITTTTNGGTMVENVGIKAQGGDVTVNGALTVSSIANNLADKKNNKVYGLWSTNGGNITINGKTTISTTGGQEIAVVAGTEGWKLGEDGKLPVVGENGINTVNLNYQNGAGSDIKGDIISGYGGNITIGNADGISTLSTRNNNGTLTLTGDALSANGGKLSINLTSGSTWTGRADDYQDADLANWADKHEEQFNPKFSHDIAASGTVKVNLAQGAKWNVTGQSWVTELDGNGVINLTNGEGSDAVHIGTVKGSNTFVVNLKPDGLDTSDMLYIYDGSSAGVQNLRINNEAEVLNALKDDGDRIRFATVGKTAGAGAGFGDDYVVRGRGVINSGFSIDYVDYEEDKQNADYTTDYNGDNFDADKPGNSYVENVYGEAKGADDIDSQNLYLVRDSSKDAGKSDSGATIINMSRANYKNAIYMDRLNKRMGEMRYVNGEEEQGLWVRLRHDRIGQSGDFRSMNTMYEVGYDVKQPTDNGEHRIGMAIDYMRGSTTYDDIMGKGETKRYGLWLYDTWLGEKGHYTDYIVKWGHLSNDFDIRDKDSLENITGDYSNNVFSVSAEYGKKNDMGNNWYFEPQAQLQLARVTGADYVTTQGSKVNVDGINSLIGRAGFRIGRDMDENSTVYLKADLLHEFMGDQTVTAADATGTLREEFENKGTWYDVGFGFAAKMSKNSYAFMDFEKSFGNDNDETYQINAGMQWSF